MSEGKRYRVMLITQFDGEFEGYVDKPGQRPEDPPEKYAVFNTDSSAGNPKPTSGRRYILMGTMKVEEIGTRDTS